MEIQTVQGILTVIKKIFDNDSFEINICKYENIKEEKLYTVIILKETDLIHKNIKMFSLLRSNTKFTDFIECFSKDSYLYVVFSYYEEITMNFEEIYQMPLMQRVEIVKQILSLSIILDIPKPILYDSLSRNNINLDASGRVYFNYFLKSVDRYSSIEDKDIIKRIGRIFVSVFNDELTENYVNGLKELIRNCENGIYKELIDIYSDYIALHENFIKSLDTRNQKKPSRFRKILNRIVEIFNKVKPVLIMLVLSIGVVYLVIEFTKPNKEKKPIKIEAIGTQHIRE